MNCKAQRVFWQYDQRQVCFGCIKTNYLIWQIDVVNLCWALGLPLNNGGGCFLSLLLFFLCKTSRVHVRRNEDSNAGLLLRHRVHVWQPSRTVSRLELGPRQLSISRRAVSCCALLVNGITDRIRSPKLGGAKFERMIRKLKTSLYIDTPYSYRSLFVHTHLDLRILAKYGKV